MKQSARLENWFLWGTSQLAGKIYDDATKRFDDGTDVRTSTVNGNIVDFEEGDVITTRNSTYTLGKKNKG